VVSNTPLHVGKNFSKHTIPLAITKPCGVVPSLKLRLARNVEPEVMTVGTKMQIAFVAGEKTRIVRLPGNRASRHRE
jgi:hypothetical protein